MLRPFVAKASTPNLSKQETQMPNLTAVLNDEIRRLARKEIREQMGKTVKQVASQRKDISRLKKENAALERRLVAAEKRQARAIAGGTASSSAKAGAKSGQQAGGSGARFSPKWLASHRKKLGLSAADYADLVGCSLLSIYKWEKGETTPRAAQRESLAEVRTLGKREALKRLEAMA